MPSLEYQTHIFLKNYFSKNIREMALVFNSYSIAAFEEIRDISRDSTDVTRMYFYI